MVGEIHKGIEEERDDFGSKKWGNKERRISTDGAKRERILVERGAGDVS